MGRDKRYDSRGESFWAELHDKLPVVVGVLLLASACIFAIIVLLPFVPEGEDYHVIDEENDKACLSHWEISEDSVLTLPSQVGHFWHKYSVQRIESHAFEGCDTIAELIIPEGVTTIGFSSFYGCKNIRRMSLPTSLVEICDGAFYGCSSLRKVEIRPEFKMGEFVFEHCTSLSEVSIDEGVTRIERSTFCGCVSLARVNLPQSLVSIDPLAFKDCESLTEVVIPDGVRDLGGCAFEMCTSLRSVVIPPQVLGIGVTAFNGCGNLRNVSCRAELPPPLGSSVFEGVSPACVLHVPIGSAELYRKSPWAEFFKVIVED